MRLGFLVCLCVASSAVAQDQPTVTDRFFGAMQVAANFDCRDVSCKRLSSCEEACYKLIQCKQYKRDGDNDGIPCENLCTRRCP